MKIKWRYMVKLNKLKLIVERIKRPYLFKIPSDIFLKVKSPRYDIRKEEDYYLCYGDLTLKKELSKLYNINECNGVLKKFNTIILKKILFILTFFVCLIILISSNFVIREIRFVDKNMYNKRVYDFIYSKLDVHKTYTTYSDDLNKLSLDLRINFPEYAYIGVSKKGSVLLVDVEKRTIEKDKPLENNKNADLISGYNAVIYGIEATNGVCLVELNQFVKKGDLLITGNLLYKNDPSNYKNYVRAKGIILGTVLEIEKIKVPKKINSFTYTSNVKQGLEISFLNNMLIKPKTYYEYQNLRFTQLVSIFNLIKVYRVNYYELSNLEIVYDDSSSLNYAISLLYYNLELKSSSEKEKILNIELLNSNFEDGSYNYTFIVKKIVNIAKIKEI